MTQLADNPFAPPQSDLRGQSPRQKQASQVWRDGNIAVCPDHAHLPDRCVLCNGAAKGYQLTKVVRWHHPAIYLVILVNLLIYAIVALSVQKKVKLTFGLCPKHRSRRTRGLWIGYLGFFLSIVALILGTANGRDNEFAAWFALGGLVGMFLLPIVGMIMASVLRPKRIEDKRAYLKLGDRFVRSLPGEFE